MLSMFGQEYMKDVNTKSGNYLPLDIRITFVGMTKNGEIQFEVEGADPRTKEVVVNYGTFPIRQDCTLTLEGLNTVTLEPA